MVNVNKLINLIAIKAFVVSMLVVIVYILVPITAFAANATDPACSGAAMSSPVCQSGNSDPLTGPNGLIIKAASIISYFIGFISVIMIIIAGIKFATSNGSSEGVASARNTIIYALIGLAIAASSQLIVRFVLSKI